MARPKRATVQQIHDLALSMPGVTVDQAGKNPVYQVGRKSFIFFRNPRPDAYDPETGERYDDVIVFWVAEDTDKQALVEDDSTPFFTTRSLPPCSQTNRRPSGANAIAVGAERPET